MAVMKIRGEDLDLVEYEFLSFHPGENIRTLGLEGAYHLTPVKGKVTVRAPARIHLTVLDMNRFAPAINVQRFPWKFSGRATTMGAAEGLTKILADAKTGRILGVGIPAGMPRG